MLNIKSPLTLLAGLFLVACSTLQNSERSYRYTGDFSYHNGIASFYDCKQKEKFYLVKGGVFNELIEKYQALKLRAKEDVYLRVEGYYQEEKQRYGIDPIEVFVATRILKIDESRGCKQSGREGL